MIFQDNVIREYLRNVYFIAGIPCGGKMNPFTFQAFPAKGKSPLYFIPFCFPSGGKKQDFT